MWAATMWQRCNCGTKHEIVLKAAGNKCIWSLDFVSPGSMKATLAGNGDHGLNTAFMLLKDAQETDRAMT